MATIENFNCDLQYVPLSLWNTQPYNPLNTWYELRNHVGSPLADYKEGADIELDKKSLINFGKVNRPKMLIWVTQYNEPLSQLVESLAGVYRAYYELSKR